MDNQITRLSQAASIGYGDQLTTQQQEHGQESQSINIEVTEPIDTWYQFALVKSIHT
jgi:hypothetical protein